MFKLYFWVHCNQGHADTLTILIPTNLSLPGRGDKESSEEDTSEHEEITEEEGLPAPGTVIVTTSVSAAEPVEAPAPADTVTESKKDDEKKTKAKKESKDRDRDRRRGRTRSRSRERRDRRHRRRERPVEPDTPPPVPAVPGVRLQPKSPDRADERQSCPICWQRIAPGAHALAQHQASSQHCLEWQKKNRRTK